MKTTKSKLQLRQVFNLIKDYFVNSDEKLIAWLQLAGIVICVVGLAALMATFAWWTVGFWAILTAQLYIPFLISIGQFAGLIAAYVTVSVLKNYLTGKLSLRWRNWLTNKIINDLFKSKNNYLDLSRTSKIDNIAQRIQEDIKNFVDLSISLASNALQSILSLATFTSALWIVGGALTFVALGLNIVIPGYLVWVALIASIIASVTTYFIGKSLSEKNKKAETAEAELRNVITQITTDNPENIAEEHAEEFHEDLAKKSVLTIYETGDAKLKTQIKVSAFQEFYTQIAGILPYLLAAPLYFSGLIPLASLMGVGISFAQVNGALSMFVTSFQNISNYKTNIIRITELKNAFVNDDLTSNTKFIIRKIREKDTIYVKRLNLAEPQAANNKYIIRNLKIKFYPGENTLITAPSGTGKSTFFKAIAGTWPYGDGKISIPFGKIICILPQKPTIPNNTTLREILAYPDAVNKYTPEQYISALQNVGGLDNFIAELDKNKSWSTILSEGQKQLVSFVRAVLKKPDWLFLDEATCSLDQDAENRVCRLMNQMEKTTIVSIAHHSTVKIHHSRVVHFHANKNKEITITEEKPHTPVIPEIAALRLSGNHPI